MSITLTTAWDPGDRDAGQTYPKANIIDANMNLITETIDLMVEYGDFDAESPPRWVRGSGSPTMSIQIPPGDFPSVLGVVAANNSLDKLHQWLIDNGHTPGTVD